MDQDCMFFKEDVYLIRIQLDEDATFNLKLYWFSYLIHLFLHLPHSLVHECISQLFLLLSVFNKLTDKYEFSLRQQECEQSMVAFSWLLQTKCIQNTRSSTGCNIIGSHLAISFNFLVNDDEAQQPLLNNLLMCYQYEDENWCIIVS